MLLALKTIEWQRSGDFPQKVYVFLPMATGETRQVQVMCSSLTPRPHTVCPILATGPPRRPHESLENGTMWWKATARQAVTLVRLQLSLACREDSPIKVLERGLQDDYLYVQTGSGGRQKEQRDWSRVSSEGRGAAEGGTHWLRDSGCQNPIGCQNFVSYYSSCGGNQWAAEVRCFRFLLRHYHFNWSAIFRLGLVLKLSW